MTVTTATAPEEPDDRERLLDALFGAYLEGVERGEDLEEELVLRAGEHAADLRARIRLERELRALAPQREPKREAGAPLQVLGRFRIIGLLGEGGISTVYLAHDPELGRHVALKVLKHQTLLDKRDRAWMLNEARALARIEHPNVVRVLEVGETGTHTYIAMELVNGPSLRQVLDGLAAEVRGEPGPADAELATPVARLRSYTARTDLLRQLAGALATCHDQGVLHRDIKPHNVLFDAQGVPKLIDFGLAHDERADEDSRIGLTQNLVGTAAYIAPEQVAGNETGADPRSDQFSFGTMAYECFALENPFQKGTQRATMAAVEAANPPSLRTKAPAIVNDLALVIHHALEREPGARYVDLHALGRDLAAVLAHRPVTVEEPSLAHVARLWFRRHRQRVQLVSLLLLGVSGILAGLSLVSTIRQWRDLRESLEAVRPDGLGTLDEFQRAFTLIESLSPEAASLDSSFWGQWLSPSAGLSIREIVHQLSKNLDRVYDDDVARNLARGTPLQDQVYRELFWQEKRLCPECVYNIENRLRGRVVLPEADGYERALDILCFEEVKGATDAESALTSIFRPAPLVELLTAGTYRFQMWKPGSDTLAMEVVFYVPPGWNPEMTIPSSLRPGPFDPATIDVPGGEHRFPNGLEMKLPGFEIMEGLVTIHDLRRFHADTGLAREHELQGPETAPAIVVYETAMCFASWAGGRLPLQEELEFAKQHGMALPSANAERIGAELLLTLGPDGNPTYFAYRNGSANMAQRKIKMRDRDGDVGFRIVIAKGKPQEYRVQAQQALLGAKSAEISEEAR